MFVRRILLHISIVERYPALVVCLVVFQMRGREYEHSFSKSSVFWLNIELSTECFIWFAQSHMHMYGKVKLHRFDAQ